MATNGNVWEDLRRQARQCENEIDLKLISFSKMGTSYSGHQNYKDENLDTVPLLSTSNSNHMFETMALEIEQLLTKLTEINDKMADWIQRSNSDAPNPAILHTLQRHRDIRQDYGHEFSKIKANIQARRQREDLLGSIHRDIDAYKNNSGLNRRTDLYLKENDHLRNSDRLIEDQINIAMATKENLTSQRSAFMVISSKVNSLANRFPLINSLMQRINLRKRRDSLILAGVIAVCIVFLILYALY